MQAFSCPRAFPLLVFGCNYNTRGKQQAERIAEPPRHCDRKNWQIGRKMQHVRKTRARWTPSLLDESSSRRLHCLYAAPPSIGLALLDQERPDQRPNVVTPAASQDGRR